MLHHTKFPFNLLCLLLIIIYPVSLSLSSITPVPFYNSAIYSWSGLSFALS
jgi:hypothetical protein